MAKRGLKSNNKRLTPTGGSAEVPANGRFGGDQVEIPPTDLQKELQRSLKPELYNQLEAQMQRLSYSTWQSDWPPGEMLGEYTTEERTAIMKAVKDRTDAAIERDKFNMTRSHRRMDRAQISGLIIALSGICGAVYLGNGKDASWHQAAIAIVVALAAIGGPNVARLIADRFYLQQHSKQPQKNAK